MTDEIPTRYSPAEIEPHWRKYWSEKNTFHMKPKKGDKPYTIVIPPPNITGRLHMGHGLNNTLQDILVRHKRMQGYNTLWLPGTDHAGIATQNVVERMLLEDNIKKDDLSTEDFLNKIWEWKDTFGNIIIDQLQSLGVSCDWSRQRFTMDEGLSQAVNKAFITLYEKGLIYRGNYMTNWCPRCRTALSDDEVEHEEVDSHLWHIKYSIKNRKDTIVVATTRPETMLGDTAVAVNPDDPRYARFIGETLILPLVKREIPVISDAAVETDFGTGAVKVTPAHDPNDYEMGLRHNLDIIRVIGDQGIMTDKAIHFDGMHRFDCREAIVRELKEKGFLEKTEEYKHSVGHCYRCSTTLEPNLSEQWFVKMKPLAKMAIDASMKNKVQFHPARWKDFYLNWLENVRDWCISRQIQWGHRIPVWYCDSCGELSVSTEKLEACLTCESDNIKQESDVLDTWFSSSLWPFSTLGWPDETGDLQFYYPTSALVTDRGIIYFWVARMVMMGLSMMENVPFSDVYIHGTILDAQGRKMSKSLGNGIDPIEMIETYGADAVRFALTYLTTEGQDVKLAPTQFEMGRNFMNKIWNASRFALMNFKGFEGPRDLNSAGELDFYDKWILSRLHATIKASSENLDKFKFSDYAGVIYDFFWHDLCDWYLEIIKDRMDSKQATAKTVLFNVLQSVYKLMHPMMPFITSELTAVLNKLVGVDAEHEELSFGQWPLIDSELLDEKRNDEMATVQTIIRSIRNVRATVNIPAGAEIDAIVSFPDKIKSTVFSEHADVIKRMAKVKALVIDAKVERPKNTAVDILGEIHIFIPLEGLIDIDKEKAKLRKKLDNRNAALDACGKKLGNHNFLENAPKEIVDKEWIRKKNLQTEIEQIENFIENLE